MTTLTIVVPCHNEEAVLPETGRQLMLLLNTLDVHLFLEVCRYYGGIGFHFLQISAVYPFVRGDCNRRGRPAMWYCFSRHVIGFQLMILKQFIKFSGVGVVGTAVQYATLFLLVQVADVYPVVASTIGFLLGAFVNYYLNYIYTFQSSKSHFEAMPKFFSVAAIGLMLNGMIMQFCISFFSLPYIIAQLIATALVLLWNFAANRMWTFMESSS